MGPPFWFQDSTSVSRVTWLSPDLRKHCDIREILRNLELEEPEFQPGLRYLLAAPTLDEPCKHTEHQLSHLSNGNNNQGIVSASEGCMED